MKPKSRNKTKFASRLRQLRIENGWSMDDLAYAYEKKHGVSISKSTISRWEAGRMEPVVSSVSMVADVFGVSPVWMLGGSEDRHHVPDQVIKSKSEYTETILRVFDDLNERNRVKLLAFAYDLWDEQNEKGGKA